MQKIVIKLFLLSILIGLLTSCYNDNEYDLYPYSSVPCDSLNASYAQTIAPIMAAHCNVCHATAIAQNNIVTDNYTTLSIVALNGQFWKGVSHDPTVSPMPKGGNKLSDCDLAKIKNWINQGSLNN